MYDKTVEELHEKMLAAMDDSYQKTVGFPTHDILKAVAVALVPYGENIKNTADKLDIYNLHGEELRRFVEQNSGVRFREATHAKAFLNVTGNGIVPEGMLFESEGGIQFAADMQTVIDGEGVVQVTALTPGLNGNVGAGSITMIPKTEQGITACINTKAATGGYAAETDNALRERYTEAKSCPPTSGNVHHYKMWAKEVPGVGDAKESFNAGKALFHDVQAYIDPDRAGLGLGQAPIGAYCTVASAEPFEVDVSVNLTVLDGYTVNLEPAIRSYLQSIAFKEDYVSYARISDTVFDVAGVQDHSDLLVNGGTANIPIPNKSVAVLGMVTIHE